MSRDRDQYLIRFVHWVIWMGLLRLVLVIAFLGIVPSGAQAAYQDGEDSPLSEKEAREFILKRSRELSPTARRRLSVPLADELRMAQFEAYASASGLSDEQRVFAAVQFVAHIDRVRALRQELVPELYERAADLSEMMREGEHPYALLSGDAVSELFHDGLAINEKMGDEEDRFFAIVQPMLAEPQQVLWLRSKGIRARERITKVNVPLPGLKIDLSRLELEARDANAAYIPEDEAQWEALWQRYDAEMLSLYGSYVREYFKTNPHANELQFQGMASESREEGMAMMAEAADRREKFVGLARRVHDRNFLFATEAEQLLIREDAARWREAMQAQFYPDLFPGPFDLEHYVETARRTEDLTDVQRRDFNEAIAVVRQRLDTIEHGLIVSTMEWVMEREKANSVIWQAFDEHRERMVELQKARFRAYNDGVGIIGDYDNETATEARRVLGLVHESWTARLASNEHRWEAWPTPR